jgi:hypothetical protein
MHIIFGMVFHLRVVTIVFKMVFSFCFHFDNICLAMVLHPKLSSFEFVSNIFALWLMCLAFLFTTLDGYVALYLTTFKLA